MPLFIHPLPERPPLSAAQLADIPPSPEFLSNQRRRRRESPSSVQQAVAHLPERSNLPSSVEAVASRVLNRSLGDTTTPSAPQEGGPPSSTTGAVASDPPGAPASPGPRLTAELLEALPVCQRTFFNSGEKRVPDSSSQKAVYKL